MKALEVCKITTPLEAAEVWLEKSCTITASSDRDISRSDIKQTERQKYQQKRYKTDKIEGVWREWQSCLI